MYLGHKGVAIAIVRQNNDMDAEHEYHHRETNAQEDYPPGSSIDKQIINSFHNTARLPPPSYKFKEKGKMMNSRFWGG